MNGTVANLPEFGQAFSCPAGYSFHMEDFMGIDTDDRVQATIRSWLEGYVSGRAEEQARQLEDELDGNEAYAKARAEDDAGAVRALEEAAKLSIAHPVETGSDWSFVADCDNWWDDGGAPPRYDVMAKLTYEDERLKWEGGFHPGYAWIQPYPTYAKILGPWPELSKITENGKEYFEVARARGPNVLDLHERLAAVGLALLPEERRGGQTVIKVVVKDGTTSVSIKMRPHDGADTTSFAFEW